jgi:hypothetical protein
MNQIDPTAETGRHRRTSKRIVALGLPVVLLFGAGAAYAWWSAPGHGDGEASTGSISGLSLSAAPVSTLVPGGTVTVPVTAVNDNATTSVPVRSLVVSALSPTPTDCDPAVYGVTAEALVPDVNVVVAPQSSAVVGSLTLHMADQPQSQDVCKSTTFSFSLTSS